MHQRVVISSGSNYHGQVWLGIDQRSDAVSQDPVVFDEENLDPSQRIAFPSITDSSNPVSLPGRRNLANAVTFGNRHLELRRYASQEGYYFVGDPPSFVLCNFPDFLLLLGGEREYRTRSDSAASQAQASISATKGTLQRLFAIPWQ